MSSQLHAIIPAAGIGSRMSAAIPKQYLRIAGKTLLEHSVDTLLRTPGVCSVTVALHPDDTFANDLSIFADPRVSRVTGGDARADSVLAALRAVPGRPGDWVLVHDAARPGLQVADVMRLVEAVTAKGEGGILAEPLVDTVKRADAQGRVESTLDRTSLWRAQTPQMFRLDELISALLAAAEDGHAVTDEASAMELAGQPVLLIPGSPANLKVTVAEDLELAAWYLSRQGEP
ncbi:MAG: 2-C-methyl-D-erythritol 4-phosphate cytidylyltransferase [Halioglobus sp.]